MNARNPTNPGAGSEATRRAVLVLEDGSAHWGESFGAPTTSVGEVVFATSMVGYQEICTDPSFRGQLVVLTYPLIGNYGVTHLDNESHTPWLAGLIVREYSPDFSNWRATGDLGSFLRHAGVPAVTGVDTRALTRRLRDFGTMRGVLANGVPEADLPALVAQARMIRPIGERVSASETATTASYEIPGSDPRLGRVVVIDCGLKQNILRSLQQRGAGIVVVPPTASAREIRALQPSGIVVSNGPGDPVTLTQTVATVRELMTGDTPLLGICLGHQVLGLAIGATTSRLKFGHHGGNHPVKELRTGEVHITSQNHEFQVDAASVPAASGFAVSHVNLNDGSVEGLAHAVKPIFSVQYHPEGAPGPQDNQYLFDKFLNFVAVQQ